MPNYLIELSHGDEHVACVKALGAIERYGSHLLTNAHWGCRSGSHSGWLIVDVDSRKEAMQIVPPEFREDARIVEVERFSRDDIAALVAELEG